MEDLDEIQGDLAKFGSVLQEAIRRITQRGSAHLGQPPVFHLDRELCRLRRCRAIFLAQYKAVV